MYLTIVSITFYYVDVFTPYIFGPYVPFVLWLVLQCTRIRTNNKSYWTFIYTSCILERAYGSILIASLESGNVFEESFLFLIIHNELQK